MLKSPIFTLCQIIKFIQIFKSNLLMCLSYKIDCNSEFSSFEGLSMEYNTRRRETTQLVIKLISSYYILN
jgi:hypothetical protein